ncbi:hypothetical protein PAU_01064 [Photorhabdus asymbiotica]|uniref:Uncharacterized protein n=1 Tax=Photorhabdus asymbiotica subsp. asymbiotica (strain ATCC 43949 / 3105-77) TaxID=553480 RepID=C7BPG6_PHOAA|nr:hypothetical protein PAU_01064 [Photorhabdus asymbiotica]
MVDDNYHIHGLLPQRRKSGKLEATTQLNKRVNPAEKGFSLLPPSFMPLSLKGNSFNKKVTPVIIKNQTPEHRKFLSYLTHSVG